MSRLASPGQPHALTAQACIVLYGMLVIAGSRPLGGCVPGHERLLGRLVALYGVAAVVAGVAPKDAPATARSLISVIHVQATIAGGVGIAAAMVLVASSAPELSVRRSSAAAVTLTCLAAIVFRFSWGSNTNGLVERLLLGLTASWVAALAVCCLLVEARPSLEDSLDSARVSRRVDRPGGRPAPSSGGLATPSVP